MVLFVSKIWDGPTTVGGLDVSERFENADFLFFRSQEQSGDELEVAAALEIALVGVESVGGSDISVTYGIKEIPLAIDFVSTTEIVRIPQEFSRTRLDMRLVLATSYSVNLAIYAASQGVTDQDLQSALAELADPQPALPVFTIGGRVFTVAGKELLFPDVD